MSGFLLTFANGHAAQPAVLSAPNLLTISCDGFKAAKAWCGAAQSQLPNITQLDTHIMMVLKIPAPFVEKARALVQHASKRLRQGKGSAPQLADLGFAQILTDQTAEGVQSLLASAARKSSSGAVDWAFVGFAALYPELSTLQQREWSNDLAGRLMRVSLDGKHSATRVVDVARVAELYQLAGDAKLHAQFSEVLRTMAREQSRTAVRNVPQRSVTQKTPTTQPQSAAQQTVIAHRVTTHVPTPDDESFRTHEGADR